MISKTIGFRGTLFFRQTHVLMLSGLTLNRSSCYIKYSCLKFGQVKRVDLIYLKKNTTKEEGNRADESIDLM